MLQTYRAKTVVKMKITARNKDILQKDIFLLALSSLTFFSLNDKTKQQIHIGKDINSARKNVKSEKRKKSDMFAKSVIDSKIK